MKNNPEWDYFFIIIKVGTLKFVYRKYRKGVSMWLKRNVGIRNPEETLIDRCNHIMIRTIFFGLGQSGVGVSKKNYVTTIIA